MIENMNNIPSLNSLWLELAITEFSFIASLKLLFLTTFILLHFLLLYTEYLNRKYNNNSESHMKSGPEISPQVKKIATLFGGAIAFYSGYITIRNDLKETKIQDELKLLAVWKEKMNFAEQELKKATNEKLATNFIYKMQLKKMDWSLVELTKIKTERSKILDLVAESEKQYKNTGNINELETQRKLKYWLAELDPKEVRATAELQKDIKIASTFVNEISTASDEKVSEIIKNLNQNENENDIDIKKSTIFDLNELWSEFNSFDGITKVIFALMFSSYLILSCVFGITSNLYGNYLLERFKLEEKYPRLARYINYRKKMSRYYIVFNIIIIVLVCLTHIVLGLSITSIYI